MIPDPNNTAPEEKPEPHLAAVPTYPTTEVPGPLGDLIRAGADAGLPAALVGGAGLGTAAAVSMNATVKIYENWTEPPTLWIPLIAPTGGAKTPSQEAATKTLEDLEVKAEKAFTDELKEWQAAPPKERGERPHETALITEDATIEALVRHLDETGGRAAIVTDELRGFFQGIGQYKKGGGSDQGRYLSLWSGAPWRYKRVTNDVRIFIERPVVPVLGGIQPEFAHLLGPEEDGMRPRWLPHLSLNDNIKPCGVTIPDTWQKRIKELYNATHKAREWTMSAAALAQWDQARDRWSARRKEGSTTRALGAALNKADRHAARIALVLAETMDLGTGNGGAIPAEAMAGAIRITDYVLGCWEAIPERDTLTLTRIEERTMPAVDKLAAWLEQHPEGKASRREISRARIGGIRTADALDAVLDQYTAVYPGTMQAGESTGGRPPIYVHAPRRRDAPSPNPPTDPPRDFVTGDKVPGKENAETARENTTSETHEGGPEGPEPFFTTGDKVGGDKVSGDKVRAESDEFRATWTPADQPPTGPDLGPDRRCYGCGKTFRSRGPNTHCHTCRTKETAA